MPLVDLAAVRKLVTLWKYLKHIGWRGRQGPGGQHRGTCPVCASIHPRSRAFTTNGEKWKCWRCGAFGDVIDLHANINRLGVYQAAVDLCNLFGHDPPSPQGGAKAAR